MCTTRNQWKLTDNRTYYSFTLNFRGEIFAIINEEEETENEIKTLSI